MSVVAPVLSTTAISDMQQLDDRSVQYIRDDYGELRSDAGLVQMIIRSTCTVEASIYHHHCHSVWLRKAGMGPKEMKV